MTLILYDLSITYPYGSLKDVFVKVSGLLFPTYFFILDMPEDSETSIILKRPFLAIGKDLIDVELGKLTLRINKEKFIFNVLRQ